MAQNSDQNKQGNKNDRGAHSSGKELRNNTGSGNASTSKGGTTDMDTDTTSSGSSATERGSGLATKRNVTGSDYDGQPAE
ncbi:MAG TPA: hypothetical protein VGO09_07490 [Flavisolibacter sp.]|nr:hypothetical protein [Flavisolibacter sp.]